MVGRHQRVTGLLLVALILLPALTGCSERRELPAAPPPPERLTYEADIKSIFDAHCVSCHGPVSPLANYDMSTYEGVLGPGTDETPNAIAGDPNSVLVTTSVVGGSMNSFYADQQQVELVRRWVVEDSLAQR
jgi:mono/diheme cytochrome c family protein